MIPYAGGVAYLLIEVAPEVFSRGRMYSLHDSLVSIMKPNQKMEVLRQKAEYSSTHKNMVEYADALLANGSYEEALGIYQSQNTGVFRDDPEILYKVALSHYYLGAYEQARGYLEQLRNGGEALFKNKNENALYLLIFEKENEKEAVKAKYQEFMDLKQSDDLELQYLKYLADQKEATELERIVARLRKDERVMKQNRMRYNKQYYREAYRLGKRVRSDA